MNEIKYNERLNLGVEMLDKAHEKLFSIIRKLVALNEEAANKKYISNEGIKYLENYTERHFKEEEAYMKSINYVGLKKHKQLHDDLKDLTLPALKKDLEESEYSEESVQRFLGICLGWLTGHIMVEDRIMSEQIKDDDYEYSQDTIIAMETVIKGIMKDIFNLELQTVSKNYLGEDFGKRVYCRLTYGANNSGEKMQVYCIYEEALVFHIVSEMLGVSVQKIDKMSTNAIKQFSPHLVHYIGIYLQDWKEKKLEKVNMLTNLQFKNIVEDGKPKYGFLFNTGKGYFAFYIK